MAKKRAQQPRLGTVRTVMDQPMGRELLVGPKLNCRLVVENEICFTLSQTHILKSESLQAIFEQRLRPMMIECEMGSPGVHTQELRSP